ncbi:MAG: hypothetical protein AB7F43_08630 [Bacteriovoracia bacterium]
MKFFWVFLFILTIQNSFAKYFYEALVEQVVDDRFCYTLLLRAHEPEFRRIDETEVFTRQVEKGQTIYDVEEFSLRTMVRRKNITPEEAEEFFEDSRKAIPRLVTYIRLIAKRKFAPIFINDVPIFPPPILITFLKMISGQHVKDGWPGGKFPGVQLVPLPWMQAKGMENLAQTVDRKKHKLIFQFARAAEEHTQDLIVHNYGLMAFLAAQEVVLLEPYTGIGLDDAYVYIHCSKEKLAKHFRDTYSFAVLGESNERPGNYVLFRNLKEILMDLTPWQYFRGLTEIMENPQISAQQGIALFQQLYRYRVHQLDLLETPQSPLKAMLGLFDLSILSKKRETLIRKKLSHFGVNNELGQELLNRHRYQSAVVFANWPELRTFFSENGFDEDSVELGFSPENLFGKKLGTTHLKYWLRGLLSYYRRELRNVGIRNPDTHIAKMKFLTSVFSRYRKPLLDNGFKLLVDTRKANIDHDLDSRLPDRGPRSILVLEGRDLLKLGRQKDPKLAAKGELDLRHTKYGLH